MLKLPHKCQVLVDKTGIAMYSKSETNASYPHLFFLIPQHLFLTASALKEYSTKHLLQ